AGRHTGRGLARQRRGGGGGGPAGAVRAPQAPALSEKGGGAPGAGPGAANPQERAAALDVGPKPRRQEPASRRALTRPPTPSRNCCRSSRRPHAGVAHAVAIAVSGRSRGVAYVVLLF